MDKIFLSVKEVSVKLNVSEKTIYRMINDNRIPYGIKIGGQWRFNAEKIDKWMAQGGQSAENSAGERGITLSDITTDGSIIYKLCGTNRDETIDQMLNILNCFTPEQQLNIKKNLLYKESIISSSLGGVSVMTADPDQQIEHSLFAVGYPDTPLDFKASDKKPTEIVLLLIPANNTEQLILTTRLRGLMGKEGFMRILRSEPTRSVLMNAIKKYEDDIFNDSR